MKLVSAISDLIFNTIRRLAHCHRRTYLRIAITLTFCTLFLDLLNIIHTSAPQSILPQNLGTGISTRPSDTKNQRIFIASLQWNSEELIRKYWGPAILSLVKHFGSRNVYISIIGSGSLDDTKGALLELDSHLKALGVKRTIELEEETHENAASKVPDEGEAGWIQTPRGKMLRRIPFLAERRNMAMAMFQNASMEAGIRFDKVLWLNDVIFTTEDVITLLSTKSGHYAAACALDFSSPPLYYDTFALRDIFGASTITMTSPYFLSYASVEALLALDPVPVKSCWNGAIIFDASPFYDNGDKPALRFRGLPDSLATSHLEASECCLIHADNKLSEQLGGVWLNPRARVGYNIDAFKAVNSNETKDGENGWPSEKESIWGIWRWRWARWTGWPWRFKERRLIETRMWKWASEGEGRVEVGGMCVVNEEQVLINNGWLHV